MTGASTTERFKYLTKLALAWLLYLVGAFHLWKRIALRGRAVVLVYHRVLRSDEAGRAWSHPAIVVSRDTFERQMRVLARWFRVLSVTEFASILQRGERFPTASCVVTFDDGWEDTYREAWPVLRRYDIPAIVFLPVGLIGGEGTFWQERMAQLLFAAWQRQRRDVSFARHARQVLAPLCLDSCPNGSADAARASILSLVQARKREAVNPSSAIPVLAKLVGEDVTETGSDRLMTWEMARDMMRGGVAFGGHGASHRILTSLAPGDLDDEVRQAREVIQRELAVEPVAFSYPNGDVDDAVVDAVRQGGFRVAFSMRRGFVRPGTVALRVPRVNIHEDVTGTTPLFLARVLGLF